MQKCIDWRFLKNVSGCKILTCSLYKYIVLIRWPDPLHCHRNPARLRFPSSLQYTDRSYVMHFYGRSMCNCWIIPPSLGLDFKLRFWAEFWNDQRKHVLPSVTTTLHLCWTSCSPGHFFCSFEQTTIQETSFLFSKESANSSSL